MPLTQVSSRLIEDTLRYVLGANGTSDYTFTGPGLSGAANDPTLTLSRGHTYVFENRNSSGAHPFYIKTSIANGGTNDAYNTGVTNNGGAGGTEIVFTVPHDAPDLLYYQCSSHSSMAGQLNIAGSVADGSITTNKLANNSVTAAKFEQLSQNRILGAGSSGGNVSELTASEVRTILNVEDGATAGGGISDVVSDSSPQLGGDLQSNGHDIKLANSDKIILGTGNDAEIFHNDTDFHIDAEASGATRNIYITGGSVNEKLIEIRSKDNEPHIRCYGDDMVQLYHDNAEKLRTMTNGIRVQGGIMFGSDSADANVLDDYEEGTIDNQNVLNGWGYLGNGSDPNQAPTMTYNGGKYVKIGSMVYVHMRIKIGSYNSAANNLVFGIMPFYADRGGTESLLESHLGCWMNACSSGGERVYAHTYGGSKYYYGIGKRTSTGHVDFTGPNGGSGLDIAINGWYRIE